MDWMGLLIARGQQGPEGRIGIPRETHVGARIPPATSPAPRASLARVSTKTRGSIRQSRRRCIDQAGSYLVLASYRKHAVSMSLSYIVSSFGCRSMHVSRVGEVQIIQQCRSAIQSPVRAPATVTCTTAATVFITHARPVPEIQFFAYCAHYYGKGF